MAALRLCWLLGSLVLLAWQLTPPVAGQGLRVDNDQRSGAPAATSAAAKVFGMSKAFRLSWNASRNKACSRNTGSACGSSSADDIAALQMAAAPLVYDSRKPIFNPAPVVGPVQDQQGCDACVAFAVLAAAYTSAATVLQPAQKWDTLSVQDFFFCRSKSDGVFERTCGSALTIREGIKALGDLQKDNKLPVVERCLGYTSNPRDCTTKCSDTLPALQLQQGSLSAQCFGRMHEMQAHIRAFGSIVCRVNIYSDFKPWFETTGGSAIYPGHGRNATLEYAHAVQVVGYDNKNNAWLCKNSWGPDYPGKGFFWFAYDVDDICLPNGNDACGLVYRPATPIPPPVTRLSPVKGRPGCQQYSARSSDYVAKVAELFNVPVAQVLLDNVAKLKEPDQMLGEVQLLLCNVTVNSTAVVSAPAPPAPIPLRSFVARTDMTPEQAALLRLLQAVDPMGRVQVVGELVPLVMSSTPGAHCKHPTISCNDANAVTRVSLKGQGTGSDGTLPSLQVLLKLPELRALYLIQMGLTGPLPAGYANLGKLGKMDLSGNVLTGTLPLQWSRMRQLGLLHLDSNQLSGKLPVAWSALSNLQALRLSSNQLTGPLPTEWAADPFGMMKLEGLELRLNQLTSTLPPEYGQFRRMQHLVLHNNRLNGPLPGRWSGMKRLRLLSFSVNQLTGALPTEWSEMTQLRVMWAYNNNLTGKVPPSYDAMTDLQGIVLSGNADMTGCLPKALVSHINKGAFNLTFAINLPRTIPLGRQTYTWTGTFTLREGIRGTNITGFCPEQTAAAAAGSGA